MGNIMKKSKKPNELRDQRVVVSVPISIRNKWVNFAENQHWSMTTLIEIAVTEFIEKQHLKNQNPKRRILD